MSENFVSFMPDTWVEGGGLWDNKVMTFKDCHFESEYSHKEGGAKFPAFVCVLVDEEGEEYRTGYSLGKGFMAQKGDGKPAATGDKLMGTSLVKSSNFVFLLKSIQDALPDAEKEDYIGKLFKEGKASAFDGMVAHMVRQKVVREGLQKEARADGKKFDDTVAVVDVIKKYPWEKKAPPGTKAAPGTTKATPGTTKPAGTGFDAETKAIELLGQIVKDNPDGISREDASAKIFSILKVPTQRKSVIELVFQADDGQASWLVGQSDQHGWTYDAESDSIYPTE